METWHNQFGEIAACGVGLGVQTLNQLWSDSLILAYELRTNILIIHLNPVELEVNTLDGEGYDNSEDVTSDWGTNQHSELSFQLLLSNIPT